MSELSRTHKQIGQRIRRARMSAGISQEDLAYKLNISATFMGSLERGERNLTVTRMLKIGQALRVDPAEFIRGL